MVVILIFGANGLAVAVCIERNAIRDVINS
jgi:hypothetical protein